MRRWRGAEERRDELLRGSRKVRFATVRVLGGGGTMRGTFPVGEKDTLDRKVSRFRNMYNGPAFPVHLDRQIAPRN